MTPCYVGDGVDTSISPRFLIERRAPILARYVEIAPGGRPHIPVAVGAPFADFAAVAGDYPVFEVNETSTS